MKSRFFDSSAFEALGVELEEVLQRDQAEVIRNEDDFNWLVRQAEGMYCDKFSFIPDRGAPDHFKNWPHEDLFNMVFACAKEGLSESPSDFPN